MKYIIGVVGMLLSMLCGAQSPPIKALTIGDSVPDITLNNMINYKTTSARLSDFRGKLLILDFWATWCGSCIVGLPKLDSLQKKFPGELQIILITNEGSDSKVENENKVRGFFRKWEAKTKGSFSLPSTMETSDSLLQLFSHIFIPHYVWIGPKGNVIAITTAEEITASNIKAAINGDTHRMTLKSDRL
jgi:thiol-disulfide isomerase/thioredoxin